MSGGKFITETEPQTETEIRELGRDARETESRRQPRHATCHECHELRHMRLQSCLSAELTATALKAPGSDVALCASCRKLNNFHSNNFPLPFSLLPFCVKCCGWKKKYSPPASPSVVSDSAVLCSIFEYNQLRKMRVWSCHCGSDYSQIIVPGRGYEEERSFVTQCNAGKYRLIIIRRLTNRITPDIFIVIASGDQPAPRDRVWGRN